MYRRFLIAIVTCTAVLFALTPITLFAHPLGNFTINRYAGLLVQPDRIDLDYVLDMAEIPAFQEISQQISLHPGKTMTETADFYRARKCAEIPTNLSLTLNAKPLSLNLITTAIELIPSSGGLLTLRLTCEYHANIIASAPNATKFRDGNFLNYIGWREIVVQGDGTEIRESSVPSSSMSDRLLNYPSARINPPNQTQAQFSFDVTAPGSGLTSAVQNNAGASGRTPDPFAALITAKDLSTQVIVLSLLLALGLGALHAVSPGHGKTLMAAYLVGTRGTFGQAVLLGLTVTVTHTLGVLMLGLATLVAAQYILPDNLYPWLSVASGLLVIGMGIALVADRWHVLQHAQPHSHHEAHRHRHGVFGRAHSHLPTSLEPGLSWKSLIGLGVVGGLVPSASALLLLLGAISLQRIPFGIVLIVAFGLGMAFVLVGVGVLFVRASSLLGRYHAPRRWMELVPFISAIFVIGAGIFMTVEAVLQVGLFNP